jgi:hypothetical protein
LPGANAIAYFPPVSDKEKMFDEIDSRASDSGRYTCEVASDGGNDRHSANLDVIELPYAPTLVPMSKNFYVRNLRMFIVS